ncbi:hypothetical protein D3C75_1066000 [compost metagenome]
MPPMQILFAKVPPLPVDFARLGASSNVVNIRCLLRAQGMQQRIDGWNAPGQAIFKLLAPGPKGERDVSQSL